ncbi:CRISPR-associated protein Csx16 [Lysobacteraceae bacterium NML71-0210]|nr:CRISPR-associated protein Csx16 [Xanthomonadaceae bacterium NML71-0210]
MTQYFISRHPGAIIWARKQGFEAVQIAHLDCALIQPGDTVMGTLPVHLAAEVCRRGGRYLHLQVNIPAELRGQELDAETLEQLGACLTAFEVRRIDD